jgi:hypothetical protein
MHDGPAFSRRAVISVKNMSHSSHLEARDQLKQAFWDVRLMGRMGSHPASPTNLGGVDGLTGAAGKGQRHRGEGPVSAGSCVCPVHRVGNGHFHRDHSRARDTGFTPPKALSGGFSGARASESG